MKKYVSDYLFLAVLAGVIVALDQWTKALVRAKLPFGMTWTPWEWLAPYARIVHWQNTGAAFGLGQDLNNFFKILGFVVVGLIIYYYPQIPRQEWPLRVALGMQLSGALGNLIDRLTIGHVTDFVSVGSFPVFNVADASISTGVVVLIIGMWIQERRTAAASTESDQPAGESDSSPGVVDLKSE